MTYRLDVNDLHFSYQKSTVFSGLSFSISQPEIIGLLGLNGAGKSTLLKIIAGILPINESDIKESQTENSTTHSIGFLPERPFFYPELSIIENIQFAAKINGIGTNDLSQRTEETLLNCQLNEIKHQLAGSISKGYQQRLGLAMAIVHQPKLLLLDEPTDGLDPQQIIETRQLISRLAENCTIIISSHRLEEIEKLSHRLLILHQGKIINDSYIDKDNNSDTNLAELFERIINGTEA